MLARDIMTAPVVTVGLEAGIHDVTALLLEKRISAVPVVDAGGKLAGIISEGDLIHRAEIGTNTVKRNWWLGLLVDPQTDARDYVKAHGKTAADFMTSHVITISEDTELAEIAQILEERKIKRLPVVKDGEPVGIVSRANILQALMLRLEKRRSPSTVDDREIKRRLQEELAKQTWSDLHVLNLTVNEGVVEICGIVGSTAQHQAILLAAEDIDGVKEVQDHLTQVVPIQMPGYA